MQQRGAVQFKLADYPDPNLLPYVADEGLQVIAAAPMLMADSILGITAMFRRQERLFTEEELNLLQAAANQFAISLERARLVQKLTLRAEHRAVINHITRAISSTLSIEEIFANLCAALPKIVPFDRLAVALLSQEGDSTTLPLVSGAGRDTLGPGTSLPLRHSAAGTVIQSGKPMIRQDIAREKEFPYDESLLSAGIRSVVIVPLQTKGKTLGTLNISSQKVSQYSEADLEYLQPIADQLASALDHARLYAETQRSAEINALLHQNSVALSTILDEPKILQELVQKTLRETGADYTYALLPDMPPRFVQVGICSLVSVPLQAGDQTLGVLGAASQEPHRFTIEHLSLLQTIAWHAASAILNARLYRQEKRMRQELQSLATTLSEREQSLVTAYQTAAISLVQLLEARDPYTKGHSDRVRHYCRIIARRLGLTPPEIADLDQAAQLHDLGKIGIPDRILHKPTTLSPAEWIELRLHPERTEAMLRSFAFMRKSLPAIRNHHERWDGRGYPDNLAGEEIPRGARILAAADAYDAMTTERPYRKALSHQEAVEELKKGAGSQWEPGVVKVFLPALSEEQPPEYLPSG